MGSSRSMWSTQARETRRNEHQGFSELQGFWLLGLGWGGLGWVGVRLGLLVGLVCFVKTYPRTCPRYVLPNQRNLANKPPVLKVSTCTRSVMFMCILKGALMLFIFLEFHLEPLGGDLSRDSAPLIPFKPVYGVVSK